MTGFAILTGLLLLWVVWDEIRDVDPEPPAETDPPVTILGDWRDYPVVSSYLSTLQPGDIIVSPSDVEIPLGGDWTPDEIVELLEEVESL